MIRGVPGHAHAQPQTLPQPLGEPELRELFALLQRLNRRALQQRFPAWRELSRDPTRRSPA